MRNLLLIFLLIPIILEAQELPSLSELKTTATPAFTMIGVQPTGAETPRNPTEFSISLLESTEGFSIIPENISMEINPYLMFSGEPLSFKQTLKQEEIRKLEIYQRDFIRNITVSVASSKNRFFREDTLGPSLGIGARTVFFLDKRKRLEKVQPAVTKIEKLNKAINDINFVRRRSMRQLRNISNKPGDNADEINQLEARIKLLNEQVDSLDALIVNDPSIKTIKDFFTNEYGWSMEIAGGWGIDYADTDIKSGEFERFGLWATVQKGFGKNFISNKGKSMLGFEPKLIGVLRYTYTRSDSLNNPGILDSGLRFKLNREKLSLSFEFIGRTQFKGSGLNQQSDNKELTIRWNGKSRKVFNLEYLINERILATFSFGDDLPLPGVQSDRTLILQTGIKFGLGKLYKLKAKEE